ncbi:MAG: hypothetical protein WC405_05910 [Syntrophales bacterium]
MEATTYSEYTIPERILFYAVKMIFWPFESLTKKCLDLISKIDEDCFV